MKRTTYAVPAAPGTIAIPATILLQRMSIRETDTANQKQGLTCTYQDGSVVNYGPSSQPITVGNQLTAGAGRGPVLGWPKQSGYPPRAADTVCTLSSMGVATQVIVEEFE